MTPRVTFFIPCYKLAHLLAECVESMLAQTYGDFEILIMDDCSPDDTAAVAATLRDPRVRYVRNDVNLGHLRNYNKAIDLARGEYVWLVSADDRLRTPDVLARYVAVMDANPRIGYAFCQGMGLRDGRETGLVDWARLDGTDTVFEGRMFLRRLLRSNCIVAPSGMVRRGCYERLGGFPLDLPFAGDWYLWCLFALHYDVAYFAAPMVHYRLHDESMTSTLIADNLRRMSRDDFAVRWRMLNHIGRTGDADLARECLDGIVGDYIRSLTAKRWRGTRFRATLADFEASLATQAPDAATREAVRRRVLAGVGRHLFWDAQLETDPALYRLAIAHGGINPKLWIKYAVLRMGRLGTAIMQTVAWVRA